MNNNNDEYIGTLLRHVVCTTAFLRMSKTKRYCIASVDDKIQYEIFKPNAHFRVFLCSRSLTAVNFGSGLQAKSGSGGLADGITASQISMTEYCTVALFSSD